MVIATNISLNRIVVRMGRSREDFTGGSLSARGRRGDVDTRGLCEASLDVRPSSYIGKRGVHIGSKTY